MFRYNHAIEILKEREAFRRDDVFAIIMILCVWCFKLFLMGLIETSYMQMYAC